MRIRTPRPAAAEPPAPPVPAPPSLPAPQPTPSWPGHEILNDPVTARVFFEVYSGDRAVVVQSPPGAGKTRLVALLAAGLAHRAQLRVAIAAQTKAQAIELARRLDALTDRSVLMWSKDASHAPGLAGLRISQMKRVSWPRTGGGVLIGTTARWLFARPERLGADVLIVDEAWQCTHADVGALGALADQIVCVGDPGQIDPVVTGDTTRWTDSPTGPHVPAPAALIAAHPDSVGVVSLPHTWRLGHDTAALIQPVFYPELPFTSRRPPEHLVDTTGTPVPELAHRAIAPTEGPADIGIVNAVVDRVRELIGTRLLTETDTRPITSADIGVVVPHVNQAAAIMAALHDHPDTLVGTANALQGMERAAVVVVHPLAGYRVAEPFALDTGRSCVMLSRHRAHATVLYDTATPGVLRAAEPSSEQALHLDLISTIAALPTI